jgi:urease accessory protein
MRLYQLASQALPVGGYGHSHGLAAAIEAGLVDDEFTLGRWIGDMMEFSLGSFEVPLLADFGAAWSGPDVSRVIDLNEEFLASRESAELRAATVQMGYSLRLLIRQLTGIPAELGAMLDGIAEPCLPCAWSCAAVGWGISSEDCAGAYLWSWVENQVLVAVKTVPLGQSAGQRALQRAGQRIAALLERGPLARPRSNFAPGLAILSSRHETQYSRLFRS